MTTVGTKGDNQGTKFTQSNAYSQESSNSISKCDECWLVDIENYIEVPTEKPQIEKVPSLLRNSKSYKACIDPLVISIGPYHHGKQELEAFEKLKTPIAKRFCYVNGTSMLQQLYNYVADVGKIARECYEKGSAEKYNDISFNRMMFLDACFVVHFMFFVLEDDTTQRVGNGNDVIDEIDASLEKSFYLVLRDLFLLENQIPLLVLKILMKFKFGSEIQVNKLIQVFLDRTTTIMPPKEYSCTDAVKKFLARMMGSGSKNDGKRILDFNKSPHLLHLMREQLIWPVSHDFKNLITYLQEESGIRESYRSVTEFQSAGIYFKPSQTGSLTDVDFKSRLVYGILTLPQIKVDHVTKPLLLNMVAYEMCPHGPPDLRITSYVCLMDSLIDRADDVKKLRNERILINKLGSDEHLAQLFNEIANDLVPGPIAYAHARSQIDKHCKSKGHVWIAESVHKYFSSPWTLSALLGAFVILALTMTQTYFAAYPRT